MQTRIHLPFFLVLFTIFSVSFSVSSATGQTLNLNNFGEVGFVIDEDKVKGCNEYVRNNPVNFEDMTWAQCTWILGVASDTQGGQKPKPTLPVTLTSRAVKRPNGSYIPDSIRFLCKQEDFMAGPMGRNTKPDCDLIAAADGGTTPPPGGPPTGVPPVINGAYQGQPGLPVVSGSYQGQPIPPSDNPLEAAKQAKELAEQNVTTATTELDAAKAARLAAEQKLADAKTALEQAEKDLEKAKADKDAELQVAEKAVEDAKQILTDAKSAWVTAKNEVMELQDKLNTVKNTYKEAEKTTRGAERALFVAENKVRRIKGQAELPVVGGSYMGQPGLPVVGGSYMGQPGLPVVGGSYQGPPQ